jgi:hypothetical protein
MWNLIATALYLRNGTFSEVLGELRRNSDLARLLGFVEVGPNQSDLPSDSALSRLHVKLKTDYLEQLEQVFKRTVEALARADPEFGKHSALDSSDVPSYARPGRTRPKPEEKRAGGEEVEVEKIESSDPEASWSIKTKRWEDGEGRKREERKSTFGYKFVAMADVSLPAVSAVDVVTGSASDQKTAVPMMEAAQRKPG